MSEQGLCHGVNRLSGPVPQGPSISSRNGRRFGQMPLQVTSYRVDFRYQRRTVTVVLSGSEKRTMDQSL